MKAKLSVYMPYGIRGSEGITPVIPNLGTRCKCVISFKTLLPPPHAHTKDNCCKYAVSLFQNNSLTVLVFFLWYTNIFIKPPPPSLPTSSYPRRLD